MTKRSLLLSSVLAVVAAAVIVSSVSAHARRKSSVPEAGEVVAASPATVEIEFTQDVQKISGTYGIEVADSSGADVTAAEAVIDESNRALMSVALRPALAPGRYVVTYRTVSDADGDEFEASFSFYVSVPPTEADLAADRELAEAEGGGDTPPAASTPSTGDTPEPAETTIAADAPEDDDGSNSGVIVIVVLASAAIGVAVGYATYRMLRGNK